VLPNFLIIGAAKAATTSLHHYLGQHPDIYISPVKEPDYYLGKMSRVEYERLFDGVTTERAIGEASPLYLNDRDAPLRVAADIPHARLVVVLRNPADRAYSSYLGRLAFGSETRSVEEALRVGTYYFESSLYFEPLSRWFALFERPQFKVLLFDDVMRDVRGVLRDLCEFLEVDPSHSFDAGARHGAADAPRSIAANAMFWRVVRAAQRVIPMRDTGVAARAKRMFLRRPEPLPTAIREQLLRDFADDIRRTSELVGRDLSGWR